MSVVQEEMRQKFISPKQFADALGVSRETLAKLVDRGAVEPPLKLSRRCFRWPIEALGRVGAINCTTGKEALVMAGTA